MILKSCTFAWNHNYMICKSLDNSWLPPNILFHCEEIIFFLYVVENVFDLVDYKMAGALAYICHDYQNSTDIDRIQLLKNEQKSSNANFFTSVITTANNTSQFLQLVKNLKKSKISIHSPNFFLSFYVFSINLNKWSFLYSWQHSSIISWHSLHDYLSN